MNESNGYLNHSWSELNSFEKWHGKWDLSKLIEAALNTENGIRNKIIANNPDLSKYTLDQLLSLPPELQYTITPDKDIDTMIDEVIDLLVQSDWASMEAIKNLQASIGYQKLYQGIKNNDKYSTSAELIKGLQDLSMAKKLGFDYVQVYYQGGERVDRDLTLEFYNTYKRNTKKGKKGDINFNDKLLSISDEVKNNMINFSLGGHIDTQSVFMELLKGGRYIVNNERTEARYIINTRKLESAVNFLIYNKYNAVDYDRPHFTSNVIFSSTKDIKLLSDMLKELQYDLNNNPNTNGTIIKFFYEKTSKNQLRGTIRYGYNKK